MIKVTIHNYMQENCSIDIEEKGEGFTLEGITACSVTNGRGCQGRAKILYERESDCGEIFYDMLTVTPKPERPVRTEGPDYEIQEECRWRRG